MLRHFMERVVTAAVTTDGIWTLLDSTILKVTRYADIQRRRYERQREHSEISVAVRALCPDLRVRRGPFRGMRYPEASSIGSMLFPKLMGTYESEIHEIIEGLCRREYTEILDIGCAEGYYAVGLSMRIPSAKVFAYDTNQEAIRLCRKMAELNGVADRVVTRSFCDADTLGSFPFSGSGLVISDCEGYESRLFTDAVVRHLARHDVVIEVHDFIDIGLSSLIRERFARTHAITMIESVDDIKKAQSYVVDELDGYDLPARKVLLGERRPAIMAWFYMTPLAQSGGVVQ